jgi:hypothetical protein
VLPRASVEWVVSCEINRPAVHTTCERVEPAQNIRLRICLPCVHIEWRMRCVLCVVLVACLSVSLCVTVRLRVVCHSP